MIEANTIICNKLGLHARAASKLAHTASQFGSKIVIICNGKTTDAKSIMSLMLLAACKGTDVTLRAEGDDAEHAITTLLELIANRFGEEE